MDPSKKDYGYDSEEKARKAIKKRLDDDYNDDDPIKIDTSDSSFLFDNEDAIIVDLKKGNSN